jgi:hypothetical protein
MSEARAAWLDGLKVGDAVVIGHWSPTRQRREVVHVQRVLKASVDVGPAYRFRRSDGRSVGGSAWHPGTIEEATPELVAEVRAENERERLMTNVQSVLWDELTTDELRRVMAIVVAASRGGTSGQEG